MVLGPAPGSIARFMPTQTGSASRRLAYLCWALGLALLGLYATAESTRVLGSRAAVERFETIRVDGDRAAVAPPDQQLWSPGRIAEFVERAAVSARQPEGVLNIDAVNLRVPIYAGTRNDQLAIGAGRVEGTARLGSDGNIAIAAHRDGFFRALKDVTVGTIVTVDRPGGSDRYRVTRTFIVNPEDVDVLEPMSRPALTLITCYPFYFLGHAPRRFIVRAERLDDPEKAGAHRSRPSAMPPDRRFHDISLSTDLDDDDHDHPWRDAVDIEP